MLIRMTRCRLAESVKTQWGASVSSQVRAVCLQPNNGPCILQNCSKQSCSITSRIEITETRLDGQADGYQE